MKLRIYPILINPRRYVLCSKSSYFPLIDCSSISLSSGHFYPNGHSAITVLKKRRSVWSGFNVGVQTTVKKGRFQFFFFFLIALRSFHSVASIMVKLCAICETEKAVLKRPKTGQQICRSCFYHVFETEIHHTIVDNKLFKPGDRIAIGASGGKGDNL